MGSVDWVDDSFAMLNWEGKKEVVAVDLEDLGRRGNHAVRDALERKRQGNMVLPPEPPPYVPNTTATEDLEQLEEIELDLSSMAAMEVLNLRRTNEVKPSQLVACWHYRRELVDGDINSTPIEFSEQAMDYAQRKEVSWEDEHDAHLLGMPVLIKGVQALKGFPRFDGFYGEKIPGPMPMHSSWIVLQIQQLGGIIAGSTNVPEFAAGSHSFNEVFKTCLNPYDLRRSAGGSSGGSAAALASRQCWLALGTDLGGSLRTPAAFCGVYGFRVSPGTVPRNDPPASMKIEDIKKVRRYDCHQIEGPMARNIFDIAVLMDALTYPLFGEACVPGGWEGLHDVFENYPITRPLQPYSWVDIAERGFYKRKRCRVALTKLGSPVREDIFNLIHEAARAIATEDFDLIEEPWPLETAEKIFFSLRAKNFSEKFGNDFPHYESLKPEIQWNTEEASKHNIDFEKAFYENEHTIAPAVLKLFENIDVLVAPATIDLPFDKDLRYPTSRYGSLVVDGEELGGGGPTEGFRDYMHWCKPAYLVSVTECPALVMPCGSLEDGMPVGVQLIAKPGDDLLLLEVAASLESALDLDFRLGIETPRTGTEPLIAIGPKTPEEAREHHSKRNPIEFII